MHLFKNIYVKKLFRRSSLLLLLFFLVSLFQNCGQGFEVAEQLSLSSQSEQHSEEQDQTYEPPKCSGEKCQIQCAANYHLENNTCVSNTRNCAGAGTNNTQTWNGSSWGPCLVSQCAADLQLEGQACVPKSVHRACSVNGKSGSQGYLNGAWNSCKTCDGDAYTSFRGACHTNPNFTRTYASALNGCWQNGLFTCDVPSHTAYIGTPSRYTVTPAQSVSFQVTYEGASSVSLAAHHVQINGPGSSGCTKSISGSGNSLRTITISGCQSAGNISVSVAAGTSLNAFGVALPAFGPSTDVFVAPAIANVSYELQTDKKYTGANGQELSFEMHFPSNYSSLSKIPILIWIHGGGWNGGSAEMDRPTAQFFAEIGFLVLNVNYTLSTNNGNYTAGPNDIKAFVNFVKNNAYLMNGDTSRITIAGSSAGAHLALLQATRPDNDVQFRCVLEIAGPTNLATFKDSPNYPVSRQILFNAFGSNINFINNASPLYHINTLKADKVIVVHQLQDNLVPIAQALDLATAIKKSKPSIPVILNYADDSNPTWINPTAEQITHVYGPDHYALQSLKHIAYSQCR